MKVVYLSNFVNSRDNNFNLIRFAAAFAVLFSHCYPTAGISDEPTTQFGSNLGAIAVDIFFITSGFLVTNSLLSRYNLRFFVWSRFLRIYPGLLTSLVVCVFIVGATFTSLSLREYFIHRQTIVFFVKNLIMILGEVGQLPGVFEQNHYRGIVNTSLWTLPWEIRMYVALALIGLLSYKTRFFSFQKSAKFLITLVLCISLSMYWINYYMPFVTGNLSQLLRLTSMFFLGAVFFIYSDRIALTGALFLGCLVALLLFSLTTNLLFIPYTLVVGYLVFYLAFIPKGAVRKFNLLPDYSYGLYIYGFPVQQSIAFLYPSVSLLVMLLTSLTITLMLASLSWHFVEKPSLNLKKHFLIAEKRQKLENV